MNELLIFIIALLIACVLWNFVKFAAKIILIILFVWVSLRIGGMIEDKFSGSSSNENQTEYINDNYEYVEEQDYQTT